MFLDVVADRYFCLSPNGEGAFSRLVAGEQPHPSDSDTLICLTLDGPLTRGSAGAPLKPCAPIEIPKASLLDADPPPLSIFGLTAAAWAILWAPIRLRLFGLNRMLATLARQKEQRGTMVREDRLAAVAASFARMRFVATERDNCLTRSLAVATRIAAIGGAPQLVIAVKLQPFAAHAWVQCDNRLVNDRYEFVREFTPILVV